MSKDQTPAEKYKASFDGSPDTQSKSAKALELALDVRKFEIDLYWKRATYFWTFTGAALAGYLTVMTQKVEPAQNQLARADALLITSSLGLIFSVAWYFVNRASKFWQANWEAHVDLLEDDVMGPIYKTVLQDRTSFWKFWGSYPFSVTKINQLLSFIVSLLFLGLFLDTLNSYYIITKSWRGFPTFYTIFTFAVMPLLFYFGRTDSKRKNELNRDVELHRRSTTIAKY